MQPNNAQQQLWKNQIEQYQKNIIYENGDVFSRENDGSVYQHHGMTFTIDVHYAESYQREDPLQNDCAVSALRIVNIINDHEANVMRYNLKQDHFKAGVPTNIFIEYVNKKVGKNINTTITKLPWNSFTQFVEKNLKNTVNKAMLCANPQHVFLIATDKDGRAAYIDPQEPGKILTISQFEQLQKGKFPFFCAVTAKVKAPMETAWAFNFKSAGFKE